MAGATFTKEELWANLEKLGEEQVRERLATKVYGDAGKKRALVVEWLREKDQSRKNTSNLEQIRIARSAKNAAWSAAIAAIIAAICAFIAILLSLSSF